MARNWSDLLPEDQAAIRADLAELDIEGRKGYLKDLGLVQKDGLPIDDSFLAQTGQGVIESISGLPDFIIGTPAGAMTTLAGKIDPEFLTPETFKRSRYPVKTALEALRKAMGGSEPPEPQTAEGQMGRYFGQGVGDATTGAGILAKMGQGLQYSTKPGNLRAAENALKSIPIAAFERYLGQPSTSKSIGNLAMDAGVAGIANVIGKEAEESVSEPYKPLAFLTGSVVGGVGPQMALEKSLGLGRSGLEFGTSKLQDLGDNSLIKNIFEGGKDWASKGYHWLQGNEPPAIPPELLAKRGANFIKPYLKSGQFNLDEFRASQQDLADVGITKANPFQVMAMPSEVGEGVSKNFPVEIYNARVTAMSPEELAEETAAQTALRKEIFDSFENTAPRQSADFDPINHAREQIYAKQTDLESSIALSERQLKESIEGQVPMAKRDELGESLKDKIISKREFLGEEAHKKFVGAGSSKYKTDLTPLNDNPQWKEVIKELKEFRKGKAAMDDAPLQQLQKELRIYGKNPENRIKFGGGGRYSASELQTRRRILSGHLNKLMKSGQAGTDEFRIYTKALNAFDDAVEKSVFPDNPDFGTKWREAREFYRDNVSNIFKKPAIKTFADVDANGDLRKIYPENAVNKLWKAGEVTGIKDFQNFFGDTKEIEKIALDSLNQELTKAAKNPNANVAKVFEGWKTKYRKNLAEMPDFAKSLDDPIKALDTISTQKAALNQQLKSLQKTSLYKLIDKNYGEEASIFGQRILRDPGAREDFFKMLKHNPDMYNSGRRFLWDAIKNEAGLTPQTINSERLGVAIKSYQNAMEKHFTPKQKKTLETLYKILTVTEQTGSRNLTIEDISPNLRTAKEVTGQSAGNFLKTALTAITPGNPFAPSARRHLSADLALQFRNKKNMQAIDTLIENPQAFEEILKAADQVENASSYAAKKKAEYGLLQRLSAYGLAHGLGETVRGEE